MGTACREHAWRLLAWVIMPEHVHLLVYPDGKPHAGLLSAVIKQPVARQVLSRWRAIDANILPRLLYDGTHRFWRTGGGYDRNINTGEELADAANYIHFNPVKHGLVKTPTEYAWSSARWHAKLPDAKLPCDAWPR